jgi:hypothetical protein
MSFQWWPVEVSLTAPNREQNSVRPNRSHPRPWAAWNYVFFRIDLSCWLIRTHPINSYNITLPETQLNVFVPETLLNVFGIN